MIARDLCGKLEQKSRKPVRVCYWCGAWRWDHNH